MIVLKGLTGSGQRKGQQFGAAVMQPWDKTLTDQKLPTFSHTSEVSGEQR